MIKDNERLNKYFNEKIVNSVYKILPLYEENNDNLDSYISSLLIELNGLESFINCDYHEFVTLLAIVSGIQNESVIKDNKATIKREVFKAIEVSKTLASKVVD